MPLLEDSGTKERYCQQLDRFQARLFRLLDRTYRDEVFSKLVALKVCNLLVAEYHFHHRHARLASRPVQLLIDPANGCQLRCPGCVHSANVRWSEQFDWPPSLLSVEDAVEMFDQFGAFACAAVLYNYGEPLLNKRFPDIVSAAKGYGLFTMTSTNFALRIDADRLVDCGLDRLTVSADGTSQATYERFRRQGRLGLVLDNIAAVVAAKRRRGTETPYLVWQYLTFEHNAAEVDTAIALARKLGVNEVYFATPFAVDGDDPSVKAVVSRRRGRIVFREELPGPGPAESAPTPKRRDKQIEAAFRTSWRHRLLEAGGGEEASRASARTCGWLYHNLTVDAARRVMPCCIAPSAEKGVKNLVYARFDGLDSNLTNSRQAVLSRQALADRAVSRAAARYTNPKELPFCISCSAQPAAPYGFGVAHHIRMLDIRGAIPEAIYESLRACVLYATAQGAE